MNSSFVKNIVRGAWNCFICSYKTSTNGKLVDHIEKTHSEVIGEQGAKSREKRNSAKIQKKSKKIPQKKMSEIMKKWNLLKKKKKQTKSTDNSFVLLTGVQCQHCLFRATDQELLKNHMEDQHNSLKPSIPNPQKKSSTERSKGRKEKTVPKHMEDQDSKNSLKPSIPKPQKSSSTKRTKGRKEKSLPKEKVDVKDGFFILNGVQCHYCLFRATDQDLLHNHMEDQHNSSNNNNKSLKPSIPEPQKSCSTKKTKGRKEKIVPKQKVAAKDGFFFINGLQCHNCKFWATSKDLMDTHNNSRHVKKMKK